VLLERNVDHAVAWRGEGSAGVGVARDADDGCGAGLPTSLEQHLPPDNVHRSKHFARGRFAHHGNRRRRRVVPVVEPATGQHWHAQHAEDVMGRWDERHARTGIGQKPARCRDLGDAGVDPERKTG